MPREIVLSTAEPVTAIECIAAAATVDPDLGVGRLWQGGGIQIAAERDLVLAVLRSTALVEDAERILGASLPQDAAWLTEVYGPDGSAATDAVVAELASVTGATVLEPR
jgi:hypothetical protein